MLNEELQDQILQTKLTYLNGYLNALELINSYSVIGMKYKLFAFNFSDGKIENAIQNNSYELFGVYSNDWKLEIVKCNNWKSKLENELKSNLTRRNTNNSIDNDLAEDLCFSIKNSIDHFVNYIDKEFAINSSDIYEVNLIESDFYRLTGIDLVFEIGDTKIVFLQITGSD